MEESDEQIEKLLEDIMMGLNILPNLERDCKKSGHVQPSSQDGTSVCHVPIAEKEQLQSETYAGVITGGCIYYQGHSSADIGTSICLVIFGCVHTIFFFFITQKFYCLSVNT